MENKTIIRRLYEEVWNERKLEVVDQLIANSHALQDPIATGSQVGPELYKRRVVEMTTGFPDLCFSIDDTIAEGEKVVACWTISGTHRNEYMGIPATGRKISIEGITIHHIKKGTILDSCARWDTLGLMRQLGAIPSQSRTKEAASKPPRKRRSPLREAGSMQVKMRLSAWPPFLRNKVI
jgi:steroid delta-isomerase-like uncharacterized protein